jgi:hypothetical protein
VKVGRLLVFFAISTFYSCRRRETDVSGTGHRCSREQAAAESCAPHCNTRRIE